MPNPVRLLYIITDSGIGGTEKALTTVLKGLPKEKYQVAAVVVLKKKREMAAMWEAMGVPVVALGMNRWPSPRIFWNVRTLIRQHQPQIVHSFLYHSNQIARITHEMSPTFKLVTSPRVNYKFAAAPALWLDRTLKNQDDWTLCESSAGKESLVKNLNYDPGKVSVAWNSVDRDRFKFDEAARVRLRAEWGIKHDEVLLGSVGRLHAQKGYDIMIDALANMKGIHGRYKAVVVGSGVDQKDLEKKAAAIGVPLRFVGERTDIPSVLSAFDVYVQSSRYEGLSNALLEAMSVGCACVATSVDGTIDVAKDGTNMLLVRPNDPISLAMGLATVVEKSTLRSNLSQNAKSTAAEFSGEKMIQGFIEAYSHVYSIS